MTRPCPSHPGVGEDLGTCRICSLEAAEADQAAGLAAVRAQIPRRTTDQTTTRGRAIARARAERKTQP
jgi:hypothetical protein